MAELAAIHRYHPLDERLASSGQPSVAQLADIAAAGYQVVLNLALHDDARYSLPDEAGSVAALGLDYVHIPVEFKDPQRAQWLAFCDAMDALHDRRVWLHCASNYRVPVFLGLYRALRQGWDADAAFAPLRALWQPDATWQRFIDEQLAAADGAVGVEDRMADYYARRAAYYERVYHKPERQADLRAMAAWLPARFAGRRVLELACGTGWWTPHAARDAQRWLATDLKPETLAVAQSKPMPACVEFRTVDAYTLAELGDETFDAAFAGCWWSHVPLQRLGDWLATLHARLAPGARVVMLDNSYVQTSSTPISRRDDAGNTYQQRRLDDGSVHEVLKNFPTPDAAFAALGPRARGAQWTPFEHYWILSYTLA